jgi:Polysaccharide pyruvyl transferase
LAGPPRPGTREWLQASFPRLRVLDLDRTAEALDAEGHPQSPELAAAWARADFLLHGSGSGFPARAHLDAWQRHTGKPFGVFGVSADPISGFGTGRDPEGGTLEQLRARIAALPPTHIDADTRRVADAAAFFVTRESLSRDYLRAQGVRTPILEFGPDTQFAMHLRNDARADAYRRAHGLEPRRYLCVVPRLRYTPYYRINNVPRVASDAVRDAINARTTESDHRKLRDMIVAYVRQTGRKVLACPEMTYEIELAREALVDPLPDDVRRYVVWRDSFWMPDEAAAIYARAQAVVSIECHSPIIALANGTPGFYVRQPTDTCKGQMYRDIGVGDWFFEIEETTGESLWSRLAAIDRDPARAAAVIKNAMDLVEARQRRMTKALRAAMPKK